jgi:cytochrome c
MSEKEVKNMKILMFLSCLALASFLALPAALSAGEGSVDQGRAHFNDPGFAGGKRACNECHPGGRGLVAAGKKTRFSIMGGTQNSLEEAVNFCIVKANKGKAIAVDSREMMDIVSYIKSLGK